jgi:hypothetical protein
MSLNELMFERIAENATRSPREAYRVLMERYDVALSVNEEFSRSASLEKALLSGFDNAGNDSAVQNEQELLDSWKYSSLYARKVLGERWKAFEAAVEGLPTEECRSSLEALLSYCRLAGDGWSGGERHVATDADIAARYAMEVVRVPWDSAHAAVNVINANQEVSARYNSFVEDHASRAQLGAYTT